jgi:YfiH family protein
MDKNYCRGLCYYTFEIFAQYPRLRHGVFSRLSPPDLGGELTFSFREDIPDSLVAESLTRAEEALGLGHCAFVLQTHSANIYLCNPEKPYRPRAPQDILRGYDALVSTDKTPLLIKLADCQGIILFHPQSLTLALIHNGWRGSVQNIAGKTVAFLDKHLGVAPSELLAGVSPSLGPCCAEFVNYAAELPQQFWSYQNPQNRHFDFWSITQDQLHTAGLLAHNIELAKICTKCQPDFYSYRRGDSGRFAVLAGIV